MTLCKCPQPRSGSKAHAPPLIRGDVNRAWAVCPGQARKEVTELSDTGPRGWGLQAPMLVWKGGCDKQMSPAVGEPWGLREHIERSCLD